MLADVALGAGIAFCIAVFTTPVGVSGAVFLVPVQISVLNTPSPAVTPTNLLHNLIAIPGALLPAGRRCGSADPGQAARPRRYLPARCRSGPDPARRMACVRATRDGKLLRSEPAPADHRPSAGGGDGRWHLRDRRRLDPRAHPCRPRLLRLRGCAGRVGGDLPDLGGGRPDLCAAEHRRHPATSPPIGRSGSAWVSAGSPAAYLGARLQARLPEALLRRGLGVLALGLGLHYAVQVLS